MTRKSVVLNINQNYVSKTIKILSPLSSLSILTIFLGLAEWFSPREKTGSLITPEFSVSEIHSPSDSYFFLSKFSLQIHLRRKHDQPRMSSVSIQDQ